MTLPPPPWPLSAAILAGGSSRRMGKDKGILPVGGVPLAERVFRVLSPLFDEVLAAGAPEGRHPFLPCRAVPDRFPGLGPLAGLHGALLDASRPALLLAAWDLPFLSPRLLGLLAETYLDGGRPAAVVPLSPSGPEPLCAIYGKECLPEAEGALREGRLSLRALLPRLSPLYVPAAAVAAVDPSFLSFRNVNTPEELALAEEEAARQGAPGSTGGEDGREGP